MNLLPQGYEPCELPLLYSATERQLLRLPRIIPKETLQKDRGGHYEPFLIPEGAARKGMFMKPEHNPPAFLVKEYIISFGMSRVF